VGRGCATVPPSLDVCQSLLSVAKPAGLGVEGFNVAGRRRALGWMYPSFLNEATPAGLGGGRLVLAQPAGAVQDSMWLSLQDGGRACWVWHAWARRGWMVLCFCSFGWGGCVGAMQGPRCRREAGGGWGGAGKEAGREG